MVFNHHIPLLLRRSGESTYKGIWEFPAGGMKKEETPMQSAIRELKEETGIVKKKLNQIGMMKRDGVIFYIFKTSIKNSENSVLRVSEEHDSLGYFLHLPENIGIDTKKAIRKFFFT
jgi:8-oxo-dGTP pyrophosphatase MutT (NUDIX family)